MRYLICNGTEGRVVEYGRAIRLDKKSMRMDLFRSSEDIRSVYAFAAGDNAIEIKNGTAYSRVDKETTQRLNKVELGESVDNSKVLSGSHFARLESLALEFGWSKVLSSIPGIVVSATRGKVSVMTASGRLEFIADEDHYGVFPANLAKVVTFKDSTIDIKSTYSKIPLSDTWYPPYHSLREGMEETKFNHPVPSSIISVEDSNPAQERIWPLS